MPPASFSQIKELQSRVGKSFDLKACKEALNKSDGDIDKAQRELLQGIPTHPEAERESGGAEETMPPPLPPRPPEPAQGAQLLRLEGHEGRDVSPGQLVPQDELVHGIQRDPVGQTPEAEAAAQMPSPPPPPPVQPAEAAENAVAGQLFDLTIGDDGEKKERGILHETDWLAAFGEPSQPAGAEVVVSPPVPDLFAGLDTLELSPAPAGALPPPHPPSHVAEADLLMLDEGKAAAEARAAAEEAKEAAEAKAAEEARTTAATQAEEEEHVAEDKAMATANASDEARRTAAAKVAAQTKAKAEEEARVAAKAEAAAEARRATDAVEAQSAVNMPYDVVDPDTPLGIPNAPVSPPPPPSTAAMLPASGVVTAELIPFDGVDGDDFDALPVATPEMATMLHDNFPSSAGTASAQAVLQDIPVRNEALAEASGAAFGVRDVSLGNATAGLGGVASSPFAAAEEEATMAEVTAVAQRADAEEQAAAGSEAERIARETEANEAQGALALEDDPTAADEALARAISESLMAEDLAADPPVVPPGYPGNFGDAFVAAPAPVATAAPDNQLAGETTDASLASGTTDALCDATADGMEAVRDGCLWPAESLMAFSHGGFELEWQRQPRDEIMRALRDCGEPSLSIAGAANDEEADAMVQSAVLDADTSHQADLLAWLVPDVSATSSHHQPPPPTILRRFAVLGVAPHLRWQLWRRLLRVDAMVPLSAEAEKIRTLLSTPLAGKTQLIEDVRSAVCASFGALAQPVNGIAAADGIRTALHAPAEAAEAAFDPFPSMDSTPATLPAATVAEDDGLLPSDTVAALEDELVAVLELLLKSLSLPYSPELGLPALSAALLLLIAHQAGVVGAGRDGGSVSRHSLRNERSDLFNGLCAILGRLSPALMAKRPWGLPLVSTVKGPIHLPTQPPNEAIVQYFWLLLRYLHPALALHLESASGALSLRISRALLSLLGNHADARAHLRLIELSLFCLTGSVAQPRAHTPMLLATLLGWHADALNSMPVDALPAAFTQLRLTTPLDAQRLHNEAVAAHAVLPRGLASSLAEAWSATQPVPPPYACAWLDPDELVGESAGGGAGPSHPTRRWVVDLRPPAEFARARFALTRHLPPSEARKPEAREAARAELREMCDEGGFSIAILTAADPTNEKGCSGMSPLLVSELVSEFLADGFAHVAIVKGGFASLTAEQRASTLVSDDVAPDFAAADRPPDRLKEAMAAAERARVEAAESAKRAGEAVRKVFNFGRKPK